MNLAHYETIQASDVSFAWACLKCDEQNYSSVSSQSFRSFQSHNSFTVLDSVSDQDSIDESCRSQPASMPSTPVQPTRFRKKYLKLKVLNVNFIN